MQADTELRSLRLLVVEDEAIIAMLVEDALTMAGHVVVGVAESAAEALAIAAREPIDLALCDVRLAENDSGITVARELSSRGVPCLYVSGNCPTAAEHPLIVGCVGKPFATAALSRAVEAAYRLAHGEHEVMIPKSMHVFARD